MNNWYKKIKTAAPYNQSKLRDFMFKALYCHNQAYGTQPSDLNYPIGQTPQIIQRRKQIKQTLQNFKQKVDSSPFLQQQLQDYIKSFKEETLQSNDPNGDWILNQLILGNSEYQDVPQLKQTISVFNRVKGKLQKKDLNQYKNFAELKTTVDSVVGSVGKTVNPNLLAKHFTLIAKEGQYSLYKANDVQGVKEIGEISGSWCTRGSYGQNCRAQAYFPDGIYEVLKGDQLFAQASGNLDQIMDLNNNQIGEFDQSLKKLLKNVKSGFIHYITSINPEYKITQEDLKDPQILNAGINYAIQCVVQQRFDELKKVNDEFNGILLSNKEVIEQIKRIEVSCLRDNKFQRFNGFDNLIKNVIPREQIFKDKQLLENLKFKANQFLQYGDLNGFDKLNNQFYQIFNKQEMIKNPAVIEQVRRLCETQFRNLSMASDSNRYIQYLENINKTFHGLIASDTNLYEYAKRAAIYRLSRKDVSTFNRLNILFNGNIVKDQKVSYMFCDEYPQIFGNRPNSFMNTYGKNKPVMANNWYKKIKFGNQNFNKFAQEKNTVSVFGYRGVSNPQQILKIGLKPNWQFPEYQFSYGNNPEYKTLTKQQKVSPWLFIAQNAEDAKSYGPVVIRFKMPADAIELPVGAYRISKSVIAPSQIEFDYGSTLGGYYEQWKPLKDIRN